MKPFVFPEEVLGSERFLANVALPALAVVVLAAMSQGKKLLLEGVR